MENALETTQRLVADHRDSLESAARRDRLVKADGGLRRRPRRWHLGGRSGGGSTPLIAVTHRHAA